VIGNGIGATIINFNATSTGNPNSPGSTLFKEYYTGVGQSYITLQNLDLVNTSSSAQYGGTALDMSGIAIGSFKNIESYGWRNGIYINDTLAVPHTFYNMIDGWSSFDDNCIYASTTNAFNANTVIGERCAPNSDGLGQRSYYGLYMNQAQGNTFTGDDWEPGTSSGTTGIYITSSNLSNESYGNSFQGGYMEANATNTQITANVFDTTFTGMFDCCATVTEFSDKGTDTVVQNMVNNFGTAINKFGTSGLQVLGPLTDANNNKFSTSTGQASSSVGVTFDGQGYPITSSTGP
jgi:hypothetical protein